MVRVIREEFTKEYRAVVLDDRAMHDEVKSYVDAIAPELSERIEFYGRRLAVALFARHGSNRPGILATAARRIYDGFRQTFHLPFASMPAVALR